MASELIKFDEFRTDVGRSLDEIKSNLARMRAIISPSLLISGEDVISINVWNSLDTTQIAVDLVMQTPSGELIPIHSLSTPTSNRAQSQTLYTPGFGFLRSLVVSARVTSPRRGETFCLVELIRPPTSNQLNTSLLAMGYVTATENPAWPWPKVASALLGRGLVRTIAGTDPAAGAEISETVPTGARWRLESFRASLVTSIVAATRRVHFVVDDGANQLYDFPATSTQAASLTRNYNSTSVQNAPGLVDSEIYAAFPEELYMMAGWRIRSVTTALDPGDNWGAPRYSVEEWLEL